MNLTKILAGLLVVLAIGLAIMAWVIGRPSQPEATSVPATAAQTPASAESAPASPTYAVVVLARPVPAGHKLTADDVQTAQRAAPVPEALPSTEAAVGRTTVSALPAGTPVLEQHLINGLSLQLEPGERAVSIAVKETMAAGHHVRPGDFVDVFFTLDGPSTNGQLGNHTSKAALDTQTRLLLARSRVLSYGSSTVEDPPPTLAQRKQAQEQDAKNQDGRRSTASSQNTQANTAVLAVPLDDVQRLALAEKYGQLTLALRHPDDTSVPDPALFAALPTALQPLKGRLAKDEVLQAADRSFAGLRFKDLASGGPAPVARNASGSAAPSSHRVQIHQGSTVQTVNY